MIDRWSLMERVRDACPGLPRRDACRAILDGHARIVDCFDHGDRRFVVVDPAADAVALTEKERSVVLLLAQELSNKVVALDLAISQATASSLLGTALRKLGVDRGTLLRVLAALPSLTALPSLSDDEPVLAQSA